MPTEPTPAAVPDWLVLDGRASDRAVRLYLLLQLRKRTGQPLNEVTACEHLGCSLRSLQRALAQLRALGLVPTVQAYSATCGATAPPVAPARHLWHGASPPAPPAPLHPPPPPTPPTAAAGHRLGGAAAAAPVGLYGEVDQVPVSAAEHSLARAALDHFNLQLGTGFTFAAWGARVVRRLREHPADFLPELLAVIDRTLSDDWWRGRPPTPAIVFGSAEQYERCQAALARVPSGPRAKLTRTAQQAADQWQRIEQEAQAEQAEPLSPAVQRAMRRTPTTTPEA